jgi:hypothetical protein
MLSLNAKQKCGTTIQLLTSQRLVIKLLRQSRVNIHENLRICLEMIKFNQYLGEDASTALKKKAEKTGMPLSVLRKVYNRGVAAWKTGHRPGTTPSQWGLARVNSFVTKSSGTWGKADKDLAAKVRSK